MYRVLNERSSSLIGMKKRLQASAFSLIVLNLVEKAVLHFLFIIMDHPYKEHSKKQATDNFQRRAP